MVGLLLCGVVFLGRRLWLLLGGCCVGFGWVVLF